jgi:hypothetical protein
MSSGSVSWTRQGNEEWADCGPLRACISRNDPDEKNIVTVKVRIGRADAWGGEDTPTYLYLPAGGLSEGVEALKRDLERELVSRAEGVE